MNRNSLNKYRYIYEKTKKHTENTKAVFLKLPSSGVPPGAAPQHIGGTGAGLLVKYPDKEKRGEGFPRSSCIGFCLMTKGANIIISCFRHLKGGKLLENGGSSRELAPFSAIDEITHAIII